jgi:hypothetical protein
MVRVKGLEPPRLSPPEPKSGVSTNSTTPAQQSEYLKQPKKNSKKIMIEAAWLTDAD